VKRRWEGEIEALSVSFGLNAIKVYVMGRVMTMKTWREAVTNDFFVGCEDRIVVGNEARCGGVIGSNRT
jgi:hypothetical protein